MSTTYFERLAALMREREVPQARIDTLVGELRAYAEEAGGDADEEFGPVAELAAQLSERESPGSAAAADLTEASQEPGEGAETWVWTADAFKEQRLLEHFGGQGWEVERLDRLGRFVCRRDLGHPMRWEYRRETVGHVVPFTVVPRLYPDFSLDTALRYFSSFPLLPVARRSNPGLLIGTLTLEDVHRAYGITEKGGTGAKLPVS